MKTQGNQDKSRGRLILVIALALAMAVCVTPLFHTRAANPTSGTINATDTAAVQWDGTLLGTGAVTESQCMDGVNCDTYTLTVAGTQADWVGKRVQILLSWHNNSNEYDIYVHKGASTSGPFVTSSAQGPGLTSQTAFIDIAQFGTGVFTIRVAYSITATAATDQYHGAVSVASASPVPPPPATADTGAKVGYQNFEAPGTLINVTSSSQGPSAATVEYLAHDAGEPSIGNNWHTGVTNFQSDLQTLFITFDDLCPSNGQAATWVNRPAPTSQFVDSDPIGFTDRQTGRTFAGELTLTSPSCKTSYTDDDGQTWVLTNGSGLASGIDHETIGGGPFHAPLTRPTGTPLSNAVYYCSQDLVTAFCSRSDNGGLDFSASIPIYTSECGGLHGHVKVAPDGTVYVPNNNCGGQGAVVVSENNGITWSIRQVHSATVTTTSGNSDPAVGIDNNGRVYFAMANADSAAAVATSDNQGRSWNNIVDVGAVYGLQNIRYPAAVAGDGNRAAVAFYGTTTVGDANGSSFNGLWHLYIAHTFDGGQTWTTSDATPGYPIQRGCIWTGGGANICRNLLDFFDMTIDSEGRVEVGYVNGCAGGNCAQSSPTASGNAYTATGTIARQSSGRRLVAAFDPPATSPPGMPTVTTRRVGPVVHLSWSEADTGNSPITSYQIMRGTASGGETFLAAVSAAQNTYEDVTATDITKTYYYQVLALNALGVSCKDNEVAAPYVGNTCSGMIVQRTPLGHPEQSAHGAAPASLAIDYIAVGEPPATSNLMFQMKVTSLATVPPNSRWRIVWNSFSSPSQQYYIGMRTDNSGVASFDYGTIATAVVALVIGVPTETQITTGPQPLGSFNPDGTITIFIPKSTVGNPQPGDLLGAVNGRTFTGDTPSTNTLERSTALVDHTFVKAQRDNGYPAATYTVVGNLACPSVTPTPTPTPTPTATPTPTPTPTPSTAGPTRFCNYVAPSGEGDDSGEPSIGVNWLSEKNFSNSAGSIPNGGTAMYFGGFSKSALKITFNDCASPAIAKWEQKPLVLAGLPRVLGDPILFTDHDTGRTFVSQLLGGTPFSTTDYTDNDGDTFMPSQGAGIVSGVDHQTIGGGPFVNNSGFSGLNYRNAIYYCSQDVADALCALSIDGGRTFGPAVPIFLRTDCNGLHGHVKVAPDGTVYVPDKACGGTDVTFHSDGMPSIAVSEDNGQTWTVRKVQGANTADEWDPSIGVATDGTIYLGYQAANGHARIAVSNDHGKTWVRDTDVGAQLGIQNVTFPAVVAGDPDRAAFAFYGTTTADCTDTNTCNPIEDHTGGSNNDPALFTGVWYLYVATTFDRGATWTTVNATPGDPIQRGPICGGGTCRNLLDFFDATVDKEGRVLVGYDDGCIGACVQGLPNSFSSKATIARACGGKRLFAAFDPAEPAVPGAPNVAGGRSSDGTTVDLTWPAPDDGNSPILHYNVYRRTASTTATLIASPTQQSFHDSGLNPQTTYLYRVTAVNAVGEGPFCGELAPPPPAPTAAPTPMPTPAACGTATTYPNLAPITINDNSPGTPYPSVINVAGLAGTVTKVTVSLNNLSHTFPDDIDILLVGPGGQNAIIMSDVGGNIPAINVTLTLDDAALLAMPDNGPLVTGTFQPTNVGAGDVFPAPAPAPSGGSALSVFNGTNPNGTWSLYVVDDTAADSGNIAGGWSVSITTNCTGLAPLRRLASNSSSANNEAPVAFTQAVAAQSGKSVSGADRSVTKPPGVFSGVFAEVGRATTSLAVILPRIFLTLGSGTRTPVMSFIDSS